MKLWRSLVDWFDWEIMIPLWLWKSRHSCEKCFRLSPFKVCSRCLMGDGPPQ